MDALSKRWIIWGRLANEIRFKFAEQAIINAEATALGIIRGQATQINTETTQTWIFASQGDYKAAERGMLLYASKNGGFGGTPKFPTPHYLSFLMRYSKHTGQDNALRMVEHTLTSMRRGGIYDHVGCGFHRYSTDAYWRLPHFEKMLYDQALLTIAYVEAFVLTRNPLYENTANEIIEYVLRDTTSPQGGFYTAEDADSEGEEGKFYLWTEDEIKGILDVDEFRIVKQVYNIQAAGNYRDEATGMQSGRNLLYMSQSHDDLATSLKIPEHELTNYLNTARNKMFLHRQERTRPHKDQKILCDWNGIMIAALAQAGRRLGNDSHIQSARKAADFLLTEIRDSNGRLYHRIIDGERAITGFLDDYAFLVWGLIELYEASFETTYLRTALELNELALDIFGESDTGALFFTGPENDLPLRKKESYDGAIPSGNSIAMLNMLRLARLTGRVDLEERAHRIAQEFAQEAQRSPISHMQMLVVLSQALTPSADVVLVGRNGDADTQELMRAINQTGALDVLALFKPTDLESDITQLAPFTSDIHPIGNRATAYLCRDHQCETPIRDGVGLARKLNTASRSRRD